VQSSHANESDQLFRTILYSIGDAVITTDAKARILHMNPVAEKLTGWREADARNKALGKVFRIIDETTRKKARNPIHRLLRDGKESELASDTILISRDGTEYYIADSAAPIHDRTGKIIGSVLVFRDQRVDRLAQRALNSAREFAESIIATVRTPFLVLDNKLEVVAANRSFFRTFQVKPEETIGRYLYDLGNRQWDIPTLRKLLETILPSNGQFEDFEVRHTFEHIGERTMLLNARRLFRERNRTQMILLAFEDVTERRRAEQVVREREEWFRRLADTTSTAIFIYQGEKLVYVNKATQRLSGFSEEELLSKRFWELVHPDDQSLVRGRGFTRRRNNVSDHYEFKILHKNQTARWIDFTAGKIIWMGQPATIGTAVDITERVMIETALRQSEERFRLLAESSLTGVYLIQHQKFIYVNQSFASTFGYTVQEIVGKLAPIDLTHRDDRARVLENIRRRIAGEIEGIRYEFKGIRKDGSITHLEVYGRRIEYAGEVGILGTLIDVSERKRGEDQLRYQAMLLQHVSDGVLSFDTNGIIRTWNKAAEGIFGYTAEEAIGRRSEELVKFEYVSPKFEEAYVRLQKTGSSTAEVRITTKSGRVITAIASASMVKDSLGTHLGYLVVTRDITEAKQAEALLRENEHRYRSIVENLTQAYYEADRRSVFTYCNPGLLLISGYTEQELLGTSSFRLVAPAHREKVMATYKKWLEDKRSDMSLEFQVQTKKGRTLWVEQITHFEFDVNGVFVKASNFLREIDERKQAEEEIKRSHEQYERFFMENLTGVYISTPEGRLLACNPAFLRIFRFSSMEEALATNLSVLYRSPAERQQLLSRLHRERKLEYHELQMVSREGNPLYLIANIIGRFDDGGRLVEIQGYLFDDTKRRQLEETLRQTQKLESIGTLASGIAHDFNNLLGIIIGHASLLLRVQHDRAGLEQSVDAITKAAQRGASLVKQILTFARKTESTFEQFDLNVLIKEMAKIVRETFPKIIELQTVLGNDVPPILADATQLQQVLLNLCVNARDAMPKGGTLTLATSRVSSLQMAGRFPNVRAPEYAMLTVKDTGLGMDEQTRQRMFEPFFTTKKPGKGTGLGLAVVHGIVQAHDGFINVESVVGRGTNFTIYLPAAQPTALEYGSVGQLRSEVRGGSETILIVEDEESLRNLLSDLLAANGYTVLAASDGHEALQLFQQHQSNIALVVSDMGLPRMTGHDLFHEIRKIDPRAKVILASGFIEPSTRSELLKTGVQDFLLKPYSNEDILVKVRHVLDATTS
jgi:PAS domain S-box-containing protein